MITAVSASASNTFVGDAALVEISSSKVSVADAIVGDSSDADAIVVDDLRGTSDDEVDEGDVIEPKKSDALVPTSPFTTVGPAQFINVGGRPCPVLQG